MKNLTKLSFRAILALGLGSFSLISVAQGDPQTVNRIIEQGKYHSQVVKRLKYLSEVIGPRLTGSPELTAAQKWAIGEFKKFGCCNVHLEKWGEVPVGFDRGPLQVARMVEPFTSEMVFTTDAWTNGTKGLVRGPVVEAPENLADVQNIKGLKGAWVLIAAQRLPSDAATAFAKTEIAGFLLRSPDDLVHTGGSYRGKTYESHPGLPALRIRLEDWERLQRNFAWGRKPMVEIGAENRWFKGPVPQYNVVAEIKGTDKPDEVVVVSGHLDSWNGPGSQGALDNGVGSMTAMEAARILTAAKAKPKRTIRFILWSGEEQGLLSSIEYVKQHKVEMSKISANLVDDGGTNYQGGYEGLATQKPIMEAAFAPVVKAFPDMPEVFRTIARMPLGGGSDQVPFNQAGVPGFYTIETGRSDYGHVHHTQYDRFEMAIPEYLVQSGTNHAVVAYNLACLDKLLPRDIPMAPNR